MPKLLLSCNLNMLVKEDVGLDVGLDYSKYNQIFAAFFMVLTEDLDTAGLGIKSEIILT